MLLQLIHRGWIKKIAVFTAIQIVVQLVAPIQLYALTSGPDQPEFNKFQQVGANDMVDLFTGDLKYNIPLFDVGGYPVNLVYEGGVGMDQEASWTGLGWNLNVGAINRQLRGLPDEFNNKDEIRQKTSLKKHIVINFSPKAVKSNKDGTDASVLGEIPILKVKYKPALNMTFIHDNYKGWGIAYNLELIDSSKAPRKTEIFASKLSFSYNSFNGTSVGVGFSNTLNNDKKWKRVVNNLGISPSVGINSSEGLSDLGFTFGKSYSKTISEKQKMESGINSEYSFFRPSPIPDANLDYVNFGQAYFFEFGRSNPMLSRNKYRITVNSTTSKIKTGFEDRAIQSFGFFNMGQSGDDPNAIEDVEEQPMQFTRNSRILPTTNYTPDVFMVNGHGVSGTFIPTLNSTGMAKNPEIDATSIASFNAGLEIGRGTTNKIGVTVGGSVNSEKGGSWGLKKGKGQAEYYYRYNKLARHLGHNHNYTMGNPYQPWYFKEQGEFLTSNSDIYNLTGKDKLVAPRLYRTPTLSFGIKDEIVENSPVNTGIQNQRRPQNTVMTMLTATEAASWGVTSKIYNYKLLRSDIAVGSNDLVPAEISRVGGIRQGHHIGEMRVLNEGGSTYVYGIPVYNKYNKDVTFNIEGNGIVQDYEKSVANYMPNSDNSSNNSRGVDNFYSSKKTGAYANSFLLTQVLSSDYIDNDEIEGPSPDDIGGYVKFNYTRANGNTDADYFQFRSPYAANTGYLNQGIRTDKTDDKATYNYGEKESWYLHSIETKTHIALFFVSPRKDGAAVSGENGGFASNSKVSYKLDRIEVYALNDFKKNGATAVPLKVVHLEYSYDLCPNVPNFSQATPGTNPHPLAGLNGTLYNYSSESKRGKLTLHKVWFTYGNMRYGTSKPYYFEYKNLNPDYNSKALDIWGEYKPSDHHKNNIDPELSLNNSDYPYTPQDDSTIVNQWAGVYMISDIHLPSGGHINLKYESDDYAYVQDKLAMQMLKIEAIDGTARWNSLQAGLNITNEPDRLYTKGILGIKDRIIFKKPSRTSDVTKLVGEESVIYFNTMIDLNGKGKFEPIQGFFEIEEVGTCPAYSGYSTEYGYLKIKYHTDDLAEVHPFSQFAWQFTNANAQHLLFASQDLRKSGIDNTLDGVKKITGMFLNFIPQAVKMIEGSARYYKQTGAATKIDPSRSFIRLFNQNGKKLGGGYRIKEVSVTDNWDQFMKPSSGNALENAATYTQTYQYTTNENGRITSSGVASNEPAGSMENSIRMPMSLYQDRAIKKLLGGDNTKLFQKSGGLFKPLNISYDVGPIGEMFYPGASVGYSKVTVKNKVPDEVQRHASGKTVSEFYTAKDFPVKTEISRIDIDKMNLIPISSQLSGALKKIFGKKVSTGFDISYKKELFAASQGFLIETNDMHGKPKAVWNYAEGDDNYSTGVRYEYQQNNAENTKDGLHNEVTVIHPDGTIQSNIPMGVTEEFVFNPKWHRTISQEIGLNFDFNYPPVLATFSPRYHITNKELRTVTFTKVIRRKGIVNKVIAYDHGASLETKNLAYDAETGQLLLSAVQNEFGDYKYSFSKPAHWVYEGMRGAWKNIDFRTILSTNANGIAIDNSGLLLPGDELIPEDNAMQKAWVLDRNNSTKEISLINKEGQEISSVSSKVYRVIRSHRRNMMSAPVETVVSETDPRNGTNNINGQYQKVINTSAVEYFEDTRIYHKEPLCFNVTCGSSSNGTELPPPPPLFGNTGNETDDSMVIVNSDSTIKLNSINQNSRCIDNCGPFYRPGDVVNPYYLGIKGVWRPYRSYVYYGRLNSDAKRNQTKTNPSDPNTTDIRTAGYIENHQQFWTFDWSDFTWKKPNFSNYTPWTWNQTLTLADNKGNELESMDALEIFSSALYGYDKQLATAVTGNSNYREMLFDGFEDYEMGGFLKFNCQNGIVSYLAESNWKKNFCKTNRHWPLWKGFYHSGNGTAPFMLINNEVSHTGWQSLQLDKGIRYMKIAEDPSYFGINASPSNTNPINNYILKDDDFIGNFKLEPNKQYVLSYWIKENQSGQFNMGFYHNGSAITKTVMGKKTIVDGWTRCEFKFTTPANVSGLKMYIENTGNLGQYCYLDDLRVYPYQSNMKSFAFDFLNYRLMASHDANNFATFFEYDAEGNLIRKKVETERGILTTSESRSYIKRD